VDEGLRFDPVIMGIPRIVVRDFDLDGYRMTGWRSNFWAD